MVLANNEWLRNSGDDQKPTAGLASPAQTSNAEAAAAQIIAKTITHESDLNKVNSMNAAKSASSEAGVGGGSTTTEERDKEIVKAAETTKLNDNANTESNSETAYEEQQEQQQQTAYEKALKPMSTTNSTADDYTINSDGGLEISRTQCENIKDDDQTSDVATAEFENNNRTYASFIDEIIVSGEAVNNPATDSNTNTLNAADLTVRMSAAPTTITTSNEVLSSKSEDPALLNLLSNANTVQRIANNFANAMSSSRLHVYGMDAAAAAQQRAATSSPSSLLNNSMGGGSGNSTARNKSVGGSNSGSLNSVNDLAASSATANSNDNCGGGGGDAKIVLICEKTSHPFETRTISLTPNIECKVGRLIAKCKPSEANAIFDCKVLSRNHAVLWYGSDGKFWVKDTNSSNGTFINDKKLNKDAAELHYGDIVKFGVDVLENSRKEVHGCIIACVKLYLPDGREAISIDSSSPRSQFSGDSRISFDDLHRLNVYMQETSQREKALKAKLYNIQNLLDATRKNSSTCWSAMISEDQLLHRIHSLEKKLQILEKNMPESALKNEIMKLIDDKTAYQHSAKEALRSVYAERCEAMQKLAKMESELAASENESKILREQMATTEESFQDVNERLRLLETEYKEYQAEAANQHLEAKMNLEQRIDELNQKLQEREENCEMLRTKITALIAKRARSNDSFGGGAAAGDDENLQKQAIDNLDAVIANMDIGDDDDEDDDDDDDEEEDAVDEDVEAAVREKQNQSRYKSDDVYDFNNSSDSSGNEKQMKSKAANLKASSSASQVVGGEATILKWLQNSDLNKKEGSLDIFKAICNESDSSDEHDAISPGATIGTAAAENFKQRCTNISFKLQSLKKTLNQFENEIILHEAENSFEHPKIKVKCEVDDVDVDDDIEDKEDINIEQKLTTTNGQLDEQQQPQDATKQQSINMLKTAIQLFSEVYEEISENFKQLKKSAIKEMKAKNSTTTSSTTTTESGTTAAMHVSKYQKAKGIGAVSALSEINEVDSEDEDDADGAGVGDADDYDDEQSVTKSEVSTIVMKSTEQQTIANEQQQHKQAEIESYQKQIAELQIKLHAQQQSAEHTLELMQMECENYKEKIAELNDRLQANEREEITAAVTAVAVESVNNVVATAAEQQQQRAIIAVDDMNNGDAVSSDSGVSSIDRNTIEMANSQASFASTESATTSSMMSRTSASPLMNDESMSTGNAAFEQQMREELTAINSTVAQREEELIAYKESLERTEQENLKLRDKINKIQQNRDMSNINKTTMLRYIVPMGIAAFGVLAYLLITYL